MTDPSPSPRTERPPGGRMLLPRLRLGSLSYRMRLVAAFVLLILSSASCTILIGNTIFGQKVAELASSKVAVDLKVGEQILQGRLETLRFLASIAATAHADPALREEARVIARRESPVQIAITLRDDSCTVERYLSGTPEGAFEEIRLGPEAQARILASSIATLATRPRETGLSAASPIVIGAELANDLGFGDPTGEKLFLAGAAAASDGTAVVLAYCLHGSDELVTKMVARVSEPTDLTRAASIFLHEKRVSSTLIDPHVLGSEADPHVVDKVIGKGLTYVDTAKVLGNLFYTAYSPLRDENGQIVGMLGIGTPEDAYTEVRNQTTTLFSSIIAAGMTFGFAMTWVFSRWLMRPVAALSEGVSRVAQGDLSYKVRIPAGDEIGDLARSFNVMVKAVKERDIKLREMTEERLSQVEKQVSIGRLAAGVAHEINNPLTAVLTLSSLVLKGLPPDDPRREDLTIVVEETTRCREIVRSLLDFARERPLERRIVDIHRVIRDTLLLTRKYDAMERASVIEDLKPEPLWVEADTKQLQQVFTNILINAAEALPGEGTIRVTTDEDSSGGYVQVRFADTGKGIPKEQMNQVFAPFFTTKGAGKGTGLGLSVSLGIVQRHGGQIEIDSREGAGTTVTVTLPRVEAPEGGRA